MKKHGDFEEEKDDTGEEEEEEEEEFVFALDAELAREVLFECDCANDTVDFVRCSWKEKLLC